MEEALVMLAVEGGVGLILGLYLFYLGVKYLCRIHDTLSEIKEKLDKEKK